MLKRWYCTRWLLVTMCQTPFKTETDGRTDGRTDRQTDGQTDEETRLSSSVCPFVRSCQTPSHTRTVLVRECFKGDEASQWKRPKFDPSPRQNPLTDRSSQKLAGVITSWMAPGMQSFIAIGLRVSALQIRDFAVPFDVTSFYVRFLGSSIRL